MNHSWSLRREKGSERESKKRLATVFREFLNDRKQRQGNSRTLRRPVGYMYFKIFCSVSGIFEFWYGLSDLAKAAVVGGPLLVIIILIICCCCCCKSRPANQGTVFVTPSVGPTAVMATSVNTTVPMRPLVNEAWAASSNHFQHSGQTYEAATVLTRILILF